LVTRSANDSSAPTNTEVNAVIGRNPVAGDIVTVSYNNANNAVVYRYTTSWITQATYITGSLIVSNTITGDKISANTITGTNIAASTIAASNMITGTITAASAIIADAAITTAKIADAQVQTLKIAGDSVSVASSYNSGVLSGGTTTYTVNYSMAYAGSIIAQIVAIPLGTWYNGYFAGSIFYWDDLSATNSYNTTSYYYSGTPMVISFEKSVSAGSNSFQARLVQVGTYSGAGCIFYVTLLRRYR
jgi:hypothetical protein